MTRLEEIQQHLNNFDEALSLVRFHNECDPVSDTEYALQAALKALRLLTTEVEKLSDAHRYTLIP